MDEELDCRDCDHFVVAIGEGECLLVERVHAGLEPIPDWCPRSPKEWRVAMSWYRPRRAEKPCADST